MKMFQGLVLLLAGLAGAAQAAGLGPRYERRWVWVMANLMVEAEADRVVALIERAGRDDYNGVVISDYKLNFLGRMPAHYFQHVDRVKAAAVRAEVEIIPGIFPIGYSNGLLSHDVNLAEGMPVVDAPFVVRGRDAVLQPDPAARIKNGDLEETKGDVFVGFGYQDAPGKGTVADRQVAHGGTTSCRMQDLGSTPVCRLIQSVKVRPHACYRLSCWAKTQDLAPTGAFRLLAIGKQGDRPLTFHEGGLEPSRDWTRVEVVFNSQDQTEVNLYAGLWGGKSGTLWIDDLALEEMALVNVLRRDGCPLAVASADGKTNYVEGKDFEPVRDPKLGQVTYEGEYEFNHDGAPLRLTSGSRIHDGDALKVSWYHPVLVLGSYAACCLSEPRVYDLLKDQARRVDDLYHPRTFFMQHDELRVANWCRACRSRNLTPGALLADNARRCTQILRDLRPDAGVVVWSDMFDPTHNAVKDYYLANGTLEGSWEGLAPSVAIANWNAGKAKASLDFFAARGHAQVLAGYYDGDDNFSTWNAAARGVPKVDGFMYTTWQNRYDDLERYGRLLREAK
ncbi:hypothetical protein [Paludisphaera mucosa]|uniref:CBM-cenC domain-containing protein n=1 Tax=Paludisphaera mucosa TaxID=3030827 RepID=A0ABT6FFS5_9BACT|nr:hypothetical protein [Paludisphaera mucosa]MDG3006374.1 hypothetical protein [Paludisphaera mucosa]